MSSTREELKNKLSNIAYDIAWDALQGKSRKKGADYAEQMMSYIDTQTIQVYRDGYQDGQELNKPKTDEEILNIKLTTNNDLHDSLLTVSKFLNGEGTTNGSLNHGEK